MSHEFQLPDELKPLEAELKARKLSASAVDRDPLIYQAGFAAGRNSIGDVVTRSENKHGAPVALAVSHQPWRNLSLALATLSAVLGLVIVRYEYLPVTDQPIVASGFIDDQKRPDVPPITDFDSHLESSVDGWSADQALGQLMVVSSPQSDQQADGVLKKEERGRFDLSDQRTAFFPPIWLEYVFPSNSFASVLAKKSPTLHRGILARNTDPVDYFSPQQNRASFQNVSFDDQDGLPEFKSPRFRDLLEELFDGT